MNAYHLMISALILMNSACTMISDNRHVSPSGKYSITFHEAKGESDSYYQIHNKDRPDFQYGSIGGSTPLNDKDIIWSPTEKTCLIIEKRPGHVGLENGYGTIRILYVVQIHDDRECHQIYMRPLERKYFNQEKAGILRINDEKVTFYFTDESVTKEWSIENLIKESYPDNYQDNEIID